MQILLLALLIAPPQTVAPTWAVAQAAWVPLLEAVDLDWVERLHPAASVGPAAHGRLLFGEPMQDAAGLYVRVPPRDSCTVPEVSWALRFLAARVRREHPGGPELVVGDISRCGGGRFPPHRTHQSGRDVDLRYFLLGVAPGLYDYIFVTPTTFDVARVWTLVEAIHAHDLAEVVYIDVRHQRALHAYAKTQRGFTKLALDPILSWPRARRRAGALVQHMPGHHNHLHIRFKAPVATAAGRLFTSATARAFLRALDLHRTGKFDHVVRRGETLGMIAQAHRVDLGALMAWNRLSKRSVLRPGDVVEVHAGDTPRVNRTRHGRILER